jgi:hypothetical protein
VYPTASGLGELLSRAARRCLGYAMSPSRRILQSKGTTADSGRRTAISPVCVTACRFASYGRLWHGLGRRPSGSGCLQLPRPSSSLSLVSAARSASWPGGCRPAESGPGSGPQRPAWARPVRVPCVNGAWLLRGSWRRRERCGPRGDRDPAALVGDHGVGDAQPPAPVSHQPGRGQLLALGVRRAQEVHLEV